MFNIRPIPSTTEIDVRKVYDSSNREIPGAFVKKDGWVLFEAPGRRKYAMSIVSLMDFDYEEYDHLFRNGKFPELSRATYNRMKSFAEVNIMLRGR